MSDIQINEDNENELEIVGNEVFETPASIRVARVVGGALLGLVAIAAIVFVSITAQDRNASNAEEDFLAAREAALTVVPIQEQLQNKYSIDDEDIEAAIGDLRRFDAVISDENIRSTLTDVQVDETRIVFITENGRIFFEASSLENVEYLEEFVNAELLPQLSN